MRSRREKRGDRSFTRRPEALTHHSTGKKANISKQQLNKHRERDAKAYSLTYKVFKKHYRGLHICTYTCKSNIVHSTN